MRPLALSVAFLVAGAASAAPVPKDALTEEQFRKLYGTRVDEKRRAKFTSDAAGLTISVGKGAGEVFLNALDAPRVVREVEGDFVARVAITLPVPAERPDRGNRTFVGAGLVVVFGADRHLQFGRLHEVAADRAEPAWVNLFHVDSYSPKLIEYRRFTSVAATDKPVRLSLTRKGKKFTAEHSFDGKKWELIKSVEEPAPEKVTLGLFALHDRDEAMDVAFTGYTVAKPE